MAKAIRLLLISWLALALASCIAPPERDAINGPFPPPPPGAARLIFYRPLTFYETTAMSTVYLNGTPTGVSQNGAVLYRDVAPGRYDLAVFSPRTYPNQFKTVVLGPGDIFYVRIDSLPKLACTRSPAEPCFTDTFIVTVVDPFLGYQQVQGLRLISG